MLRKYLVTIVAQQFGSAIVEVEAEDRADAAVKALDRKHDVVYEGDVWDDHAVSYIEEVKDP